jgi:two-component system OmpR family sensor kinase
LPTTDYNIVMSIRIRLTLWYTLVLAGILLIFDVAVYRVFTTSQIAEVDRSLKEVALDLQGANTGEPMLLFPGQRILIPRLNTFSLSTFYVQVWDAQGVLQARSDNIAGYRAPLDGQTLSRDLNESIIRDVTTPESGAALRVLTVPLTTVGSDVKLVGWLQVATTTEAVHSARSRLLSTLIQGSVVGVILAALMGAVLARRALNPIDAITQTAVQITRADDLGRRIPHLGPLDEVGKLAGAFNEMLERLERIFNAQRRFVADVSHELRTPLTTIRGNVDLLRRMGGGDSASLDAIQSETERMIRLVGDLLLLARADAGHLPIAHEPVEVDALLGEIAFQARVLAGGRVEVSLDCPELVEERPVTVMGDRDRLKQLLLNLVDNAVKHTPDGGTISLCLGQVKEWTSLSIRDTGRGIPAEDLPHIFDRFYRAEKSRRREPASGSTGRGVGVGLGLSIARWIAEAHGGYIEVESEEGQGSAFHVWLPLAELEPA